VVKFLKFVFHVSVLSLIILSLFPGSLVGWLFYGDLSREADLVKNPFGTSINHFIFYVYISLLGFSLYMRSKNFKKLVYSLFLLSIILELLQFVVPFRTFQLYDLLGNFLGVLLSYFLVSIYLHLNKS
tara:strand:- start:788 stop:1171 length:384 start_codon:yes stop_codon:yes gene_type:complete